ncbi:MAG TPA: adenosylcobalamin-dependent ribonucleoside-diphosphate reductase [Telluria sp.]|nr:adenosylcobalamin-dependent ribonucleoside-diphosphate reductase [Telluria sp.]
MTNSELHEPVSELVWRQRYRLTENGHAAEPNIEATWERVALSLADVETAERDAWRRRFYDALHHFRFLPAGRILAGAGSHRPRTLFNCFASGQLHDSVGGIFGALTEAMLTLQAGGGVGIDFSPLRPHGTMAERGGTTASGPVSFLHIWDHACGVMGSTRPRQGAMLAALRCDHPDIEAFIDARRHANGLRHFTLSVLVTDAFLDAVERGADFPLVFPLGARKPAPGVAVIDRVLPGADGAQPCAVTRLVDARSLWNRLTAAAVETGDPGVLFIDRIERLNNLYYDEHIATTNPCGEAPLPPHAACNLGSINLAAFVHDAYGAHPRLDLDAISTTAAVATRMLDDVHEASVFPLKLQEHAARRARRIGLGVTGLADALAMLGLRYDSADARQVAAAAMRTVCHAAYRASTLLAQEKGVFPAYRPEKYLEAPFIQELPPDIREGIRRHGIRNSHLTAIAPAGSISVAANNVSCGIAPIRLLHGHRRVAGAGRIAVRDFAFAEFRALIGEDAEPPAALAEAGTVGAAEQLAMMAALQPFVDQAISNTVWLNPEASAEDCRTLYRDAYRLGLKGCAVYRPAAEPEH